MFVCELQPVCSIDSSSYTVRLGVVCMSIIPVFTRQTQKDKKLEIILGYIVGLKFAWAIGDTTLNCYTIRNLVIFIGINLIEIMS